MSLSTIPVRRGARHMTSTSVCMLCRVTSYALNSFPEKEGWDRVLGLNVKGIYYCAYVSILNVLSAENYVYI